MYKIIPLKNLNINIHYNIYIPIIHTPMLKRLYYETAFPLIGYIVGTYISMGRNLCELFINILTIELSLLLIIYKLKTMSYNNQLR